MLVLLESSQKLQHIWKMNLRWKISEINFFCLGLHIEHLSNGIFVHQSTYTKKVLKHFYIDNVYPLSTPMVVWSLNAKKDPIQSLEDDEEILGPKVSYLSVIGALMYLTNCTISYITFVVNLLARYSSTPIKKTLKWCQTYTCYLRGITKLRLF